MTPKEALYYLLTEAITNSDGTNKPENEHVKACYELLTKSLTPPTADEVCEALSEYEDFDEVNYDVMSRGFYSGDTICYLGVDYQDKPIIIFEYELPTHLITLIGRFYQSLEVK